MTTVSSTRKQVVLLRHAEALSPASAGRDIDRPLSPNGHNRAKALGQLWAQEAWIPELVITSPARRTLETLEGLQEGLGSGSLLIEIDPSFYLGGRQEIMVAAAQLEREFDRLLFIGHNPGWSEALTYLSGQYMSMQPGQAAELLPLDLSLDWMTLMASPGSCQLGRIW